MTTYRLTRNLLDRVLGGVCGGIGDYIGLSGWWVRLAFLILTLISWPVGILGYVLLWMLLPSQALRDVPPIQQYGEDRPLRYSRAEGMLVVGMLAIVIGVVILLQSSGAFAGPQGDLLAPGMALVAGFVLMIKHVRGQA
jgi:phage shock protein C